MKNHKSKPELLVLTHGKNQNLQFFDPIYICPECFSDKLMALDKGNETYILHEGWLFNKVCSYRTFSCNSCDCEFMQFGNDVRKEKVSDFSNRIKTVFVIFFIILWTVSLILMVLFAILEKEGLTLIFLGVMLLSMIISSVLCES